MPKVKPAIEEIFKRYKYKIYRLALSIARNEKDAEDILQNTFLKIINNLKNFRNESLISTWIYRIAYNEALMYLRKKYRQLKLSDDLRYRAKKGPSGLFVNWSKLPDEQLLDGELKERIDSAIRHMPLKYRMALLLNNVEGLPLRDIGRILGLKLNSVKTRLHRARLIVKSQILAYFQDHIEKPDREDKRCSSLLNFVYDYAGGHLDKDRQFAFDRHIEDCSNCKYFLDSYLQAINITNSLQCQDIPRQLQEKIESFLFKN